MDDVMRSSEQLQAVADDISFPLTACQYRMTYNFSDSSTVGVGDGALMEP